MQCRDRVRLDCSANMVVEDVEETSDEVRYLSVLHPGSERVY